MRKRKYVKYQKERVVVSDTLPYEIPITFSNRPFCDFLIKNKVNLVGNKISLPTKPIEKKIAHLLLGIPLDGKITPDTIPFQYDILHNESDSRKLSLIHPKSQLAVANFYDEYCDLILYYCTLSPFSIRKPHRVAKYTYFKDSLHLQRGADEQFGLIEENDKEYKELKTFFVYKKYSNIYKFYESYQYHRCEKKYDNLFKFDISKCFDTIYTHSVSWALLNKEIVKKEINNSKDTFGGRFDKLMQNLNYNETNGIVIGPEFSRIFAELILQKIDSTVKKMLDQENIFFKKDYEIFRYVDDYFIFYNSEPIKDRIVSLFKFQLKEFKLSLNDRKTEHYKKPIITEITIAKKKIVDLLNKYLTYKTEKSENGDASKEVSIQVNANRLITSFKTIIHQSRIEYRSILNYSLALIENKIKSILTSYFLMKKRPATENELIKSILELLDFIFFIYSVSPRVNTSIKLCRILRLVTETISQKKEFNLDYKHLVFKKIYDNIILVLHKNRSLEHNQVETLYLLIALSQLGREYWLSQDTLASYLCIKKTGNGYIRSHELNYFTIVVSLFYMKNKVRYKELRNFIIEEICQKFVSNDLSYRQKKAELIFLLFDCLTCPYIADSKKRSILALYRIDDSLHKSIIEYQDRWFTDWQNFNFGRALDAKKGLEVY